MTTSSDSPENDPNLSGLGRALLDTGGSKPSGPWVPPTAEELHAILPQYEIVKMLGRGGMGAVYMGRQTALDRPVAIKILSAQLEESDLGFTERFKNEARAMGKLNHPAIVSVYEFGEHESGLLYIVMEYVDGTDVARMIAKSGRLHTEHAMAITAHVCDALAYAHERGIIHRDIKPANIMVGYDGMVKVTDFGLAKVSSANGSSLGLTQSGMAMGTLHFMAPEALMLGTAVDHRADIYAVGVMLYQMLTGKLPQGMFKMPSLQIAGLDPRYDDLITKAMMEDRDARYQSAREMRAGLDGILTQPVIKVESAETASPAAAALPTQARPQRPGGAMRQPYPPPQSRTVIQPEKRGSLIYWVFVLVLGTGIGWMLLDREKQTSPLAAAPLQETAPTTSAPTKTAASETQELDWEPMFTSDSLAGWTGDSAHYQIANGILKANAKATNLISPKIYRSFALKFDLKLSAKANSGISFWEERSAGGTMRTARAFEIQLTDNTTQPVRADSRVSHGSILDRQGASVQNMGPLGSWNEHEVCVIGTQVTVIVNGTKVVDIDLLKLKPKKGDKPIDLSKRTGHIGILGRSGPVEFRNMRIKSYDTPTVTPAPNAPTAPNKPVTAADTHAYAWLIGTWKQGYGMPPTPALSMALREDYTAEMTAGGQAVQGRWNLSGKKLDINWANGHLHEINVTSADAVTVLTGKGIPPSGDSFPLIYRKGIPTAAPEAVAMTTTPQVPASVPAVKASTTAQPSATAPSGASADVWVDVKGRAVSAKFVRIEGVNVMLEIAGKVQPVALSTLSFDSQQIARNLARQSMPKSLRWLLGGWAVFAGPGLTTGDDCPAVFLSDGTVCYAPETGVCHTAIWKLENEQIVVDWDAKTRWVLPVPGTQQPEKFRGDIFVENATAARMVLMPRGEQGKPPTILPSKQDLAGKEFRFFARGLRMSSSRPDIRLETDGRVRLADAGNEVTWEFEDGLLVLRAADGRPTSVYHKFRPRGEQWACFGPCLEKAGMENILTEK